MGNLTTKSKKSKKNSGHVLNTSPISNTNICSNPNANTCPNPNLNSCPNPTEKKNQMKEIGGSDTSTPEAQEKCQKCGSTEFIPVCYGYPSGKAMEKYPSVLALYEADMEASKLIEGEKDNKFELV